ncbi:hypothetical protein HNQ91_006073 [Filimonas zeae]|uniref:Uncharacterized protein n=1 Tax=Filimonas zeae TaxID=1737353 RepID=A0A917J585_9BACT|nr:hypothetical protein [Filimonas zeae]MDR6342986.1 hypothetical protein [Filimonas zeae]GGH83495.1 hypothetical protein GCM10011379_58970 [Filimonas zeae]
MNKVKWVFLAAALIAGAASAFSAAKKRDSVVYGIRSFQSNTPSPGITTYHVTNTSAVDYGCSGATQTCTGVFPNLNTTSIRVVEGAAPNYTITTAPANFSILEIGAFEIQD